MEIDASITTLHPEIMEKGDEYWNVKVLLSANDLLDNRQLLGKLNELKKFVAKVEDLPVESLRYEGIIKRCMCGQGIELVVKVIHLPTRNGEPVIHFEGKKSKDGTVFPDMKATIDIYPLDSQNQLITIEKIQLAIQQSGVYEKLLNSALLPQKVRRVIDTQCPLENSTIAIGSLPQNGEDAQVELFFPTQLSQTNDKEFYGSRRVKKGDIICHKIPPTEGKKPGTNVKGETIPPQKGFDIKLHPLKGVTLCLNELEAVADVDGVVVIKEITADGAVQNGSKIIPAEIQLKVNPVLKVDGKSVVDVTTNQTVEVEGDLKTGSKILTEGEVHISGSVEEGSVINSGDNISIEGDVAAAELCSEMSILAQGNVTHTTITAKDQVVINGELNNSNVVCSILYAQRLSGSTITARNSLIVDYLDVGECEIFSNINIGAQQFIECRLQTNKDFLTQAESNLKRIAKVVGEPFVRSITDSNLQQQWGKFCNTARNQKQLFTNYQLADLRTLFQNIPMLRSLIQERQEENLKIEKTMSEIHNEDASIEVRNEVGRTLEVRLNGESRILEASQQGIRINSKTTQGSRSTDTAQGASILMP